MVTLNENGLFGTKPYWYKKIPSRNLPNEIWVQHYSFYSPDSFEVGDAYSLHQTKVKADKFKSPLSQYVKSSNPFLGYVSNKTLEKILDKEKKPIFITDEPFS